MKIRKILSLLLTLCLIFSMVPMFAVTASAGTQPKDIADCTVGDIAAQTYTGEALTPAVTVKDGSNTLVQGNDYTLSYKDSKSAAVEAANLKNAGTYTVVITGTGNYTGSVTKTFTVNKSKELKLVAVKDSSEFGTRTYSLVYNGQEQCSDTIKANKFGGKKVNYQYSTDGGKSWTSVGSYNGIYWCKGNVCNDVVQVKLEDPNYETATCAINFTIAPTEITLSNIQAQNKTYDAETTATVSFDKSGILDGTDVSVNYTADFYNSTQTAKDENAGTNKPVKITFSLEGEQKDNYKLNITEATGTADISPKKLSITGTIADGKNYDGNTDAKDKVHLGSVSGVIGSDKVTVEINAANYSSKDAENGKDVTVSYKLTGDDAGNYAAPDNSTTNADIEKTTLTVRPRANQSKTYDGQTASGITYEYSGQANDETPKFTGNLALENAAVNAGIYNIVQNNLALADNGDFLAANYTLEFSPTVVTYTINKRNITLTSASTQKVYDGKALVDSSVTVSGGGFVGAEGADYSVTGTQTNVGSSDNDFTYTLKQGTDTNNYNITIKKGTLEVTPHVITITADSKAKVYGEKDPKLTAVVADVPDDFDVPVYTLSRTAGEAVGSYTITPIAEQSINPNYAIKCVAGAFTIKPQEEDAVQIDTKALEKVLAAYQETNPGKEVSAELVFSEENVNKTELAKIEAVTGTKKLMAYDMSLVVKVDGTAVADAGSTNDELITYSFPFDCTGKQDIQVFRCHEDAVEAFAATPNADGEYAVVNRDTGTITVCAKKYSTFAVAYAEGTAAQPTATGAAVPNTGDSAAPAVWGVLSVVSIGLAMALFLVRRRKAEK